jgi:hypothetical protein
MRRTVASLLMTLANVALGLAVTCWWLDHTVFDPGRSNDVAAAVLSTTAVQDELTAVISEAIATELGQDPDVVAVVVDQAAQTAGGAALLADVVVDSHAVLIGESEGPVVITPTQLAELLGDERALLLPPIEVPVPTIGVLDSLRRAIDVIIPITALLGVGLGLLAVVLHPARHRIVRRWGIGLLMVAVAVAVVGYVIPVVVIPSLTSSPWVQAMPSLAREQMALLLGTSLVCAGAGLGLVALSGVMARSRRRPDGWPAGHAAPQRKPPTYGGRPQR